MENANPIKKLGNEIAKHSPVILTVTGCAGVVGTAVLAAKATPKAIEMIDLAERRAGRKLKFFEKVKTCWIVYLPAGITGAATIASIIGSNRISEGRLETMAAAYSISEQARRAYKEKVLEEVGPKKEEKIRANVVKDDVKNNPPTVQEGKCNLDQNEAILGNTSYLEQLASDGTLAYEDSIRGIYWKCTSEKIKAAEREINWRIENAKSKSASLNEFYRLVGLSDTDYGNEVGWNMKHPCSVDLLPLWLDEEKMEHHVIGISFNVLPVPGYDNYCYDEEDYAPWESH